MEDTCVDVHIVITGLEAGQTWLFEEVGQQGQKRLVATYRAKLTRLDGTLFWFTVTRDSARVVFGQEVERFAVGTECPPSKPSHPYHAKYQQAPRNGDCLLLYEGRDEAGYYLYGQGKARRNSILIHATPASSLGCFGIGGGALAYRLWWKELLQATYNFAPSYNMYVHVEPRPASHHERHLAY